MSKRGVEKLILGRRGGLLENINNDKSYSKSSTKKGVIVEKT